MARSDLILPQADASCGKLFFPDRRTADGHRVGLEVWYRATGRTREGYRLAVLRCKRCGGFHIGRRPIERAPERPRPLDDLRDEPGRDDGDWIGSGEPWGPLVDRASREEPAWA